MNTLVLKCSEIVNNSNLRMMNELRFDAVSSGNGTSWTRIRLKTGDLTIPAKYKVMSGNAHITLSATDSGGVTEKETVKPIYIWCPNGSAVISITNFALVDAEEFRLETGVVANSPKVLINTRELTYGENLVSIVSASLSGKLSEIPCVLNSLTAFSQTTDGVDFRFSLEDIVPKMPTLQSFFAAYQICTGGDLYNLLTNYSVFDFQITNTNNSTIEHNTPVFTCTYSSEKRSSIPSMTFQRLSTYSSGQLNKETVVNCLQYIADGIADNKITVAEETPRITLSVLPAVKTDSDVSALKTTLNNAGITVNLY